MLKSWLTSLKWGEPRTNHLLRASIALACVLYKLWPYMSAKHSVLRSVTRKELAEPVRADLFPQYMRNPEGLYLYIRRWLPTVVMVSPDAAATFTPPAPRPVPRAVVFLVHGFAEHSSRYEHVARVFNAAGIALYAIDHQGHGLSDGDRAHVERFDDYVRDYALFVAQIQAELDAGIKANAAYASLQTPGDSGVLSQEALARARPPCFLLGHSMGGLIATLLAEAQRQPPKSTAAPSLPSHAAAASVWPWAGLMLSGPALELDPSLKNPVLLAAGHTLSYLLPKLPVQALDASGISTLPVVRTRYERDPLVYRGAARARFGIEFLSAIKRAIAGFASLRGLPLLVQHGNEDPICPPAGSRALIISVGGSITTGTGPFRSLPDLCLIWGGRHEILADAGWEDVAQRYLEWVQMRS